MKELEKGTFQRAVEGRVATSRPSKPGLTNFSETTGSMLGLLHHEASQHEVVGLLKKGFNTIYSKCPSVTGPQ